MKDKELIDLIAEILAKNKTNLDKACLCMSCLLNTNVKTKAKVTKTKAKNKMKSLPLPAAEPKPLKLDRSPRAGTRPRTKGCCHLA
jgi:hypothetical protein